MPSGSNRWILLKLKNNGTHARYIFTVATRLRVKIAKLGNSFPFLARLHLRWGTNQFLLCRSARTNQFDYCYAVGKQDKLLHMTKLTWLPPLKIRLH